MKRKKKRKTKTDRLIAFEEDLDFEIAFYETLLKDKPEFVDALIALGDVYTKRGHYKEGLKVDLKLSELKPNDAVVHYNLDCSYSLLEEADECLGVLRKAIELGYREFDYMSEDPDLEYIRKDPRYKALILSLRSVDDANSLSDPASLN